jgi:hypothetical protein
MAAEKTYKIGHKRAVQLLDSIREVQAQRGDWRAMLDGLEETFEFYVETTAEPERVILRKFPHDGKVLALLPDRVDEDGKIDCVDENGTHAFTHPDFGDTVAAEEGECLNLLNILRRQDFWNIRIVKRFGKLGK